MSSLSWEVINLILLKKKRMSVSAVMFCKQFLAYAVHIDWCYHSIHKHTSRSQHTSIWRHWGMDRRLFAGRHLVYDFGCPCVTNFLGFSRQSSLAFCFLLPTQYRALDHSLKPFLFTMNYKLELNKAFILSKQNYCFILMVDSCLAVFGVQIWDSFLKMC